jgi:hypothetical protein
MLAVVLRPGNANANHAGDHIAVLTDAFAQIPAPYRRNLLVRADTAGATHQLLSWLTEQGRVRGRHIDYAIGFPVRTKGSRTRRHGTWQGARPRRRPGRPSFPWCAERRSFRLGRGGELIVADAFAGSSQSTV